MNILARRFFVLVVVAWPIFIGIPQSIGSPSRVPLLSLLIMSLLIGTIAAIERRASPLGIFLRIIPLVLFLTVYVFAIARGSGLTGTTKIGLAGGMVLFAMTIGVNLSILRDKREVEVITKGLLLSIPVYLIVNVAMLPFFTVEGGNDFQKIAATQNETLAMFGIFARRLDGLPMVAGTNVSGVLAGLGLVISISLFSERGWRRIAAFLGFGACGIVLVLMDSRASVALAVFTMVTMRLFAQRGGVALLAIFFSLSLVSAWCLGALFDYLNGTGAAQDLIRGTQMGARLGVGSGRAIIWNALFETLSAPQGYPLNGYGYYGQVANGAIYKFNWIFGDRTTIIPSVHNASLQILVDTGYLGVLFYTVFWLYIIYYLWVSKSSIVKILCSCLIFIVANGFTEVAGTPYHFELFLLLIGISVTLAALRSFDRRAISYIPIGSN